MPWGPRRELQTFRLDREGLSLTLKERAATSSIYPTGIRRLRPSTPLTHPLSSHPPELDDEDEEDEEDKLSLEDRNLVCEPWDVAEPEDHNATPQNGESGGRLVGLWDDERRKQKVAFFNPKIGRSRRVLFVDPPRGTLHILDPFSDEYLKKEQVVPPLTPRAEYGMAQVGPTTIHFSGGREYSAKTWSTIRSSVELDLATFQYRFRDANLPSPTLGHGAAHVRDGLFLIGGVVSGKDGSLRLSRDCLVYPDAARDSPPLTGAPMIHARRGFAVATALDQSAVYVIGGKNNDSVLAQGRNDPFLKLMSLCERYDPARDVWTPLPSLPEARSDALATCTESGRVMVLGGHVYEMKADCFHATVPSVGLCLDPRQGRWVSAPDTDLVTLNAGFKTNAVLVNHPRAGLVLVDGVSGRIGVMEERMESWRVLKGAALDTDVQRELFNAFPIIA